MDYEKQKKDIKEEIMEMVEKIENQKFLMQIWTILKRHIEKRGD